jgi:hypothetical protein
VRVKAKSNKREVATKALKQRLREGTTCQTWVGEEEAERKRFNYWSSGRNKRDVEWPHILVGGGRRKIAGVLPPIRLNT